MNNIFAKISFDGSNFKGFQSQPDGKTVQDYIEKALSDLYNQKISINGSGRTDAGVHSLGMGINFHIPNTPQIPLQNLEKAANDKLPDSVFISDLKYVPDNFHARYSTAGKAYAYIINHEIQTPFNTPYSLFVPEFKEFRKVRKALKFLEGEHDFSAFTVKSRNYKNTVRRIYKVELIEFGDYSVILLIGNGFMYKMLRSIMGSVLKIGIGKNDSDSIKILLESHDRKLGEKTAEAKALFLLETFYDHRKMSYFDIESNIKKLPLVNNEN